MNPVLVERCLVVPTATIQQVRGKCCIELQYRGIGCYCFLLRLNFYTTRVDGGKAFCDLSSAEEEPPTWYERAGGMKGHIKVT